MTMALTLTESQWVFSPRSLKTKVGQYHRPCWWWHVFLQPCRRWDCCHRTWIGGGGGGVGRANNVHARMRNYVTLRCCNVLARLHIYAVLRWCNALARLHIYAVLRWCNVLARLHIYAVLRWCNVLARLHIYAVLRWCICKLTHLRSATLM